MITAKAMAISIIRRAQADWRAADPRTNLDKLSAADVARLDIWYDAGIRDFFNAQVSTNSLMGALGAKGAPARVWEGFPAIVGAQARRRRRPSTPTTSTGRRSAATSTCATAIPISTQATSRRPATAATSAPRRRRCIARSRCSITSRNRWPDGDRAIAKVDSANSHIMATVHVAKAGRMSPYSVILPPGYTQPENASKRYPVVYFMHGYGMDPEGIAQVSLIAQNAMVDSRQPDDKRMPKFILVLVDGKCRPGGDVQTGPLPTDGDLCEEGTFYTEHPEGDAKAESELIELQDYIDANYRTKMAADVQVTE